MKKSLLISASLLTLSVVTGIYAQTTTGTSIVEKMKAAAQNFTLSALLNPGETGLQSTPVKGKKTGDILTAGEYNRILELLSEGGSGGGAGWVDVPLTDTADFDKDCLYRYMPQNDAVLPRGYAGIDFWMYPNTISATHIINNTDSGAYGHIYSSTKASYRVNGADGAPIIRMQKLCGGGGGGGSGAGWENVPLTDTNPFNQQCMYRVVMQGQTYYPETVHEDRLYWINTMYFDKANKSVLVGGIAPVNTATKMEKLCGGTGGVGRDKASRASLVRNIGKTLPPPPGMSEWPDSIICTFAPGENYIFDFYGTSASGGNVVGYWTQDQIGTYFNFDGTFNTSHPLRGDPKCGSSATNIKDFCAEGRCIYGSSVGSGSGASSPAFYKCTNAQSLDASNVPCYGASRNQGLGDGRYRVISCHIRGSTGHESINSQLLNFGRTGYASYQNKWNSLYTDGEWQLCVEGSVLVADTQASGGGSSSTCPSGFVAVGGYCIEPTMGPTNKTWYEAAVACADKDAQLCSWSQWSVACKKNILTDVKFGTTLGKYEWIDEYTGDAFQGIADPRVYSDCEYLSRAAPKTPNATTAYRCCASQK